MDKLHNSKLSPYEKLECLDCIKSQIQGAWRTDEIRRQKPSPQVTHVNFPRATLCQSGILPTCIHSDSRPSDWGTRCAIVLGKSDSSSQCLASATGRNATGVELLPQHHLPFPASLLPPHRHSSEANRAAAPSPGPQPLQVSSTTWQQPVLACCTAIDNHLNRSAHVRY